MGSAGRVAGGTVMCAWDGALMLGRPDLLSANSLWMTGGASSPSIRLMGGERQSTTRARLAGQICCACKIGLPPPHSGRESYCARCQPVHRVYMAFERRADWHVTFTEEGHGKLLSRPLRYSDPAKIVELARRGGHPMNLEGRQALDLGISNGRGGVTLKLTPEQFKKLR